MQLRGLFAATCAAAVSLCPQVSAQQTFNGSQATAAQRQTRQTPTHERCIRIEFEDSYGFSVETAVTYSKMDGSTETVPAGALCELTEVSDLLTLRFKNPLTAKMQQMDLDLRGRESLDLRIRMDDGGGAKVVRIRQGGGGLIRQSLQNNAAWHLNGLFGAPNDDCANAMDIGSADSFDYFYAPFVTTTDGPEACDWFGETQIENDTWFKWTAPCTGIVFATNCDAALGDSKVAVYDGATCPEEGSAPLACNDDFCGPFFLDSAVAFEAVQGQEYLFRVGKSPATKLFAGGGTFSITCVAEPENDLCENAVPVSPGSSTFGTTFAANVDTNVPESCPGPFFDVPVDSPGVWYEVIGTGGEMRANICNSELNFLSRLTVYYAEGGCEDLTCVGAVRNQVCLEIDHLGIDPAVNWCSTEGAVYKILVHGALGFAGQFRLDVDDLGECLSDPVSCGDVIEKFGACCDGGHCFQTTEGECVMLGGEFLGDGVDCCGSGLYKEESFSGVNPRISPQAAPVFAGFVDDADVTVSLGFCFDFFGETYEEVTVTSNGLLVFGPDGPGSGSFYDNESLPNGADPNNMIAALWDDWVLDPSISPNANVYVETVGEPGARTFLVEWVGAHNFLEPCGFDCSNLHQPATFQTRLSEATGSIVTSFYELPPLHFAGERTVGIENRAGTEGYEADEALVTAGNRVGYFEQEDTPCGTILLVLGANQSLNFSDLDGGLFDLDEMVDGVFTAGDLVIDGAQIVVDVPHATFDIAGKLTMTGQGRIDGQTAFMQPVEGPSICVLACRGVDMQDDSRITSRGSVAGGHILVCSERGGVTLDFHSAINAGAYNESSPGTQGGSVEVIAKKPVALLYYLTHITASGERAGEVYVASCDGSDRAVELFGRLQAVGYGLLGQGGFVFVEARKGGAFVSTVETLKTNGGPFGQNGISFVTVATTVNQPVGGLLDTQLSEGYPSSIPCSCALSDTIDPNPEGEQK